jgi:hypothetical protein
MPSCGHFQLLVSDPYLPQQPDWPHQPSATLPKIRVKMESDTHSAASSVGESPGVVNLGLASTGYDDYDNLADCLMSPTQAVRTQPTPML